MTSSKLHSKMNRIINGLKAKLELMLAHRKIRLRLGRPDSLAYRLLGEKIDRFLPVFEGLDTNLQKSRLKINFKNYVSLACFTSILTSFSALILIPCLLAFVLKLPFFPVILFSFGGTLFVFSFSIIGFYLYPIYRADKLKRNLESELSFTTGYMAILASAGVSPEEIFNSLSNLSVPSAVATETKDISRDVNLFGIDIISALKRASKQTPSGRFQEMLEGTISTIHSGGDLGAYLRSKSKQYMKLKKMSLRKFSDTLSLLSEFYVALLVTGPLLLVIMLAVMAMLGGSGLGVLNSDVLLTILTYIGIPLGSIMFLLVLDAISLRW